MSGCAAEALGSSDAIVVAEQALQYEEADGLVSIEAEEFTLSAAGTRSAIGSRWVRSRSLGWSSGDALTASPNAGVATADATTGPRLDYRIQFETAGRYYVWVRLRGLSAHDDSVHVGVDGRPLTLGGGVFDHRGAWHWEQYSAGERVAFDVAGPGERTLNVWMREDGTQLDKVVLTLDPRYVPNGLGPAATVSASDPSDDSTGAGGSTAPAHAGGGTGSTDDPSADDDTGSEDEGSSGCDTDPSDAGVNGSPASISAPLIDGAGATPGADTEGADPDAGDGAAATCLRARQLWADDFETGDYSRWTSNGYVSVLNQGGCFESGFSSERAHGGSQSHRTAIGCASSANHRIYGGLQFSGDSVVPRYTNAGSGIDAPNGIVVTYWSWLDAPGFGNGRWFSFFTTNNLCDWSDTVVTFGLEDASNQIAPAHITSTGGTMQYPPTRSAFPFREWARTTVYLNYHTGVLHVWQNGVSQMHGTFRRRTNQICQFHWGLYANGSNTSLTLFEDDYSIWKLDEPLTTFDAEPWLGETQPVCR